MRTHGVYKERKRREYKNKRTIRHGARTIGDNNGIRACHLAENHEVMMIMK